MLAKLPPEVLHVVAQQLPGADLKSLSLVSQDIRKAVFHSLWSSITIHSPNETKLYDITTEGFPDPCIHHATQLRFAAPFQIAQYFRCPDRVGENEEEIDFDNDNDESEDDSADENTEENSFDNGNEEQEDDSAGEMQEHDLTGPLAFERLSQRASSFMGKFKQDRLRSFSWDMGCCVPETILGENGLLPRMHPSLKSLRLITDPNCDFHQPDLSTFRNLKSICWKGPPNKSHRLLETVIKNNAHHLDSLEIDLPHSWKKYPPSPVYVNRPPGDDNSGYFGNTLKLHDHITQPVFQQLTSLVLVHAPLGPAMVDMINFDVLRSLTLRLCPGWGSFTQRIVKMGFPIKLKTFELHHDSSASFQHRRIEVDEQDPNVGHITGEPKPGQSEVEEFIEACEGLEELFLNLPKPDHARSLWKHIARHEASLKRLVLHHRTRYCNRSVRYWKKVDLPSLGLTEHGNENRPYHPPSQNPLGELKLECLSLSCFPELAKFMLESSLSLPALSLPSLSLSSLKLIHIRQTGTDLQVFGSMAVELGFRLDTYEANNRGEDYEYDFDIPNVEDLKPQTPDTRELQDTFQSLVKWAFGPRGPPMLETVAYGDFAHEGRANPVNRIFCSSPGGFRAVPRDGYEWMSIVDKYRNVLEACPSKPLLRPRYLWMWEDDE